VASAKWTFTKQGEQDLFVANPDKYAPQYGGHCAFGASEGYISKKATSGKFEIVERKAGIVVLKAGRRQDGARNSLVSTGADRKRILTTVIRPWPKLKAKLEAQ